jgi:uncharacterized protein YyaL (SSP411 family)
MEMAERTLRLFGGLMARSPMAAGQMLNALDFYFGPVKEIAVVGDAGNADVQTVLRHLRQAFRPHQVVAWKSRTADSTLPLLKVRKALGDVTTYVCADFTCKAPIVGATAVLHEI